jgi:hypothetical protein
MRSFGLDIGSNCHDNGWRAIVKDDLESSELEMRLWFCTSNCTVAAVEANCKMLCNDQHVPTLFADDEAK